MAFLKFASILLTGAVLAGCQQAGSSTEGTTTATEQDMATARQAVAACAQHMPDMAAVRSAVTAQGFGNLRRVRSINVAESAYSRVAVAFSSFDALEKVCAVTVSGMSPAQGMALIPPWVALTNGVANETLSRRAAGAWRGRLGEDLTFTAVMFESEYKPIEGGWIRMIVIDR